VRHGCVLFDSGTLLEAAAQAAERDLWPDPERKLRQARRTLDFAERLLASGDHAAALEQTRGALIAHGPLVAARPRGLSLARAELPAQLTRVDQPALARALEATIHERPDADDLGVFLAIAHSLTG
jgi:hypothetical protein